MPIIRLISDVAPSKDLTAGIMLERIIQHCGESVDWTLNILVDETLNNYEVSNLLDHRFVYRATKPTEYHPRSFFGFLFRNIVEKLAEIDTNAILKKIIAEESRNKSDLIIVVLQGQSTYRIARSLLSLDYPVSLVFWDPWSWWKNEKFVPPKFDGVVLDVHRLAKVKGFHILPSGNFVKNLHLAQNSIVLYPSFDVATKDVQKTSSGFLRIAFAGQAYAINEIAAFIGFLDERKWRLDGKEVRFDYFGRNFNFNHPNVQNMGWHTYDVLIEYLKSYDYGFMPYPSREEMLEVSENSFPSKLAIYLTANLGIIYVGPRKSSVLDFLEQNNMLEIDHINSKNEKSFDDGKTILKMTRQDLSQEESEKIYENNFSHSIFNSNIKEWLSGNNIVYTNNLATAKVNTEFKYIYSMNYFYFKKPFSFKFGKYFYLPNNVYRKTVFFKQRLTAKLYITRNFVKIAASAPKSTLRIIIIQIYIYFLKLYRKIFQFSE